MTEAHNRDKEVEGVMRNNMNTTKIVKEGGRDHTEGVLSLQILKPGGLLLFRDYGLYDMTQVRFISKRDRKVGENYYQRADGTRTFFFSIGTRRMKNGDRDRLLIPCVS